MRILTPLLRSTLFVPLLSVLMVKASSAQDMVKVAPEHTKVLLENDQVRVVEVWVKPGEKIGMHSHPAHILYLLTPAKMKTSFPDGKTAERELKAGDTVWNEPVTHANENVGTAEIRALVIELKGSQAAPPPPAPEKK